MGLGRLPDVVGEETAEDDEGEDLEDEARERDAFSDLDSLLGSTHAGQGATCGLQDERYDITWDKYPVEELGLESREGCVDEVDAGVSLVLVDADDRRVLLVRSRDLHLRQHHVNG